MKYCGTCKTNKPDADVYKRTGDTYRCRDCNTAYCKKYRQTNAGKNSVAQAVKKYEATNPQRRKAWAKAGYLIKTKPCEVCGAPRTHRHHPDINKPLDVQFLCPLHHKEAHKNLTIAL